MRPTASQIRPLLLNVGLGIQNADWNWQDVCSPFTRVYYVTEGHAEVRLDHGSVTLRPGHLYLIPSFTRHSYVCDSRFVHYYIHIYEDPDDGDTLEESFALPCEVEATPLDLPLVERLCALNPRALLPGSDPETYDNHASLARTLSQNRRAPLPDRLETSAILQMLLSRFLRQATPRDARDARVETALAYIRAHLCEGLDVGTLADMACMSKDHFIRLFHREKGTTPLQYVNQKKMEKAQLMLLTSDLPVKGVAERLAYDDYSYFCRLFKKTTGFTPQLYRQSTH